MFDTVDPESVGMNAAQLARVGQHLEQRYVEPGKIAGCQTLIARHGRICYAHRAGFADRERQVPLRDDSIFRIYSMTKPVTSVALMQLYERGLFSLTDPVHRFIPEWRNLGVFRAGSVAGFMTDPCERPMQMRDLLLHMSGLTYDFLYQSNVDHAYRKLRIARQHGTDYTTRDMIEQLATLPLEFSPGRRWNYSVATDVLGYLVEVLSGQSLPDYFKQHIFDPLGMHDTAFEIAPDKVDRLTACYERGADKSVNLQDDPQSSSYRSRSFYSGGGGLLSTAADYLCFCEMLRNEGSLEGARILGPRTVDFMTRNHLPGNADLSELAMGSFSETAYEGVGFGLGFAMKIDAAANASPANEGSFYWGGLASTLFWVDPIDDLVVLFLTQLMPSSTFNFRGQLEALIYPAIDD